jgi:hypothetical protein
MTANRPKRLVVRAGPYAGQFYVPTSTIRGRLTKVAIFTDETFPTPSETAWLKPHELADGKSDVGSML